MDSDNELNDIFHTFASAFMGLVSAEGEIAFPEALDREQLDGSLDSLHVVDQYLDYVHTNQETLDGQSWALTVLRAGAYVGEVIRLSAAEGLYQWIDYEDWMAQHPEHRELIPERTAATCAFLVREGNRMIMPANKVARYIHEGLGHSVHYLACLEFADWKDEDE